MTIMWIIKMKSMKKYNLITLAFIFLIFLPVNAQITFPGSISSDHPRILTDKNGQSQLQQKINSVSWAASTYNTIKSRIDPFIEQYQTDPTYMVSRLQMYWKSQCTNVYVQNDKYVRADGYASIPTVRFAGARDWATNYSTPSYSEIIPYSDSTLIYLYNRTTGKWEWANPALTGQIIENLNRNILSLARDAAFLYWFTGDAKYAKFAHDIFKTYMYGMYYLNPPVDLGKTNTIIGLQTFEVIHDSHLEVVSLCYDFLYDYFKNNTEEVNVYTAVLKKWAEQIIKNGNATGNWNLFQATFITHAALALENNSAYADNKGIQYYLDLVFNQTSTKQGALTSAVSQFDPITYLWNEAPGYSMNVSGSFLDIIILVDRVTKNNLLDQLPILKRSVPANAQYLFPFLLTSGFGDTGYSRLPAASIERLISISRQYNNSADEDYFTRLLDMQYSTSYSRPATKDIYSLFQYVDSFKSLSKPGALEDFASPALFASNVNVFYQRNGFDKIQGLAAAVTGKKGGHSHYNGISIEFSGKGYALGVESGAGASYWTTDHAEYNSKYPAHNTVIVNGKSASGNPYTLLDHYPVSQQNEGFFPHVTYSNVYMDETTTGSDQKRLTGIIRTSGTTGYFIDIFRSKQRAGGDIKHDYLYHNQGVFGETTVTDTSGVHIALIPTDELTSDGGQLPGYNYFNNEKSATYIKDFITTFKFSDSGTDIFMKMWMKGDLGRKIYIAEGPKTKAFSNFPSSIRNLTIPVMVVRQTGEAWTRPFIGVFEPFTSSEPAAIKSINYFHPPYSSYDFAGIEIKSGNLSHEFVFTNANETEAVTYRDMKFKGSFGVLSENADGFHYIFLGKGQNISKSQYSISAADTAITSALTFEGGQYYFTSDGDVVVTIPDTYPAGSITWQIGSSPKIQGDRKIVNSRKVVSFNLSAVSYNLVKIEFETGMHSETFREFQIIPNPTSGTFNLILPDNIMYMASIDVLDSSGKSVIEKDECMGNTLIDLSDQSAGVYIVKIVSESEVVFKKVLKI